MNSEPIDLVAGRSALRAGALLVLLVGLLPGCTLGDSDDGDSPYDNAGITAPAGPGVADGATPVAVDVTGRIGSRLTLMVSDGARFVLPDPDKTAEKTVFLEDDGTGTGKDTVHVIATKPGSVRLYFKIDPLYDPEVIEFLPLHFAAGPAKPTGYLPGLLIQEACIAINTTRGSLTTVDYVPPEETVVDAGVNIDAGVDDQWFKVGGQAYAISTTAPTGLTCPGDGADAIGWVGFARVEYRSAVAHEQLVLTYRTDEDAALGTDTVDLVGADFPGYAITASPDPGSPTVTDSFASVTLAVTYKPVGDLEGATAKEVTITERFVPEPGPALEGSSSGGPQSSLATGGDGQLTLFFSNAEAGTWAWYVTPSGGQPTRLADLVLPGGGGDGDGDGD